MSDKTKPEYYTDNCVICGERLWLLDCDAGSMREVYRVCSLECYDKLPEEK